MASKDIIANRGKHRKASLSKEIGDEADSGNPLVHLMYEFLTLPRSSRVAQYWALATCWMVVTRIIAIGLESCDGPNQYHNRPISRPRFDFLLSETSYWQIYIVCMVPLVIDSFARLVTLCFVVFGDENIDLYEILRRDKLEIFLFTCDIFGVVPFFIHAVYIHPNQVVLSQAQDLILTMMELLITGRILRVIKDIPAIRAIRIALSKAAEHLVLPLFFFFLFNITSGVFLYFAEPCYNADDCPWFDLFQSSYYSIVTMTTVGYGNQVPSFELGRFIACSVMIFGALFLSMPLAIIGNEYDKAWCDITEENAIRAQMKLREEEEIREALLKRKMPLTATSNNDDSSSDDDNSAAAPKEAMVDISQLKESSVSGQVKELINKEEMDRIRAENERQLAMQSSVMITHRTLTASVRKIRDECKVLTRITPALLMQYCELRAWLPVLSHHVSSMFDTLEDEKNKTYVAPEGSGSAGLGFMNGRNAAAAAANSVGRRLSVFGGGGRKGIAPAPVIPPQPEVVPSPSKMKNLNAINERDNSDDGSDSDSDSDDNRNQNLAKYNKLKQQKGNMFRKASDSSRKASDTSDTDDFRNAFRKDGEVRQEDLPRHLRKQQSILFKVLKPPTSRTSVYARVLKAIGVEDIEAIRRRSMSEDFLSRMEKISTNPTTLRSRIWIMLELPHSSTEAWILQMFIILLIALSIFLLYTQTITKLTPYGPGGALCGKLLKLYCGDKTSPTVDSGCFQQFPNGTASNRKLEFGCDHDGCFGYGVNFGSPLTNMSCTHYQDDRMTVVTESGEIWNAPFQDKEKLIYNYGKPYLFTSRAQMHLLNPICRRVECMDNSHDSVDASLIWIAAEFTINLLFSLELGLRILVAESVLMFFKDIMNVLDMFAVLPFYMELFNTVSKGPFANLDFSILASSPEPIIVVTMRSLKVFRMYKLSRHFQASKVLTETATKVWKQILGMLALLAFFVVLLAIFLYQVEGGTPCFVGDPGCVPPDSVINTVHIGDRILINKMGEISQFGNVFFGIWFSFVTITTTGYGDVTPVTNIGQVMAIFLMIAGTFYMSMPLTAAASTFYQVHEKYQIKHHKPEVAPEPITAIEDSNDKQATVATLTTNHIPAMTQQHFLVEDFMDMRLRLSVKNILADLYMSTSAISDTFDEMQAPVANANDVGVTIAQQPVRKPSTLMKSIVRQINTLDRSLSLADKDLLALVLLYNEYLRHCGGGSGASQLGRLQKLADKNRKKSRDEENILSHSNNGSRRSSGQ